MEEWQKRVLNEKIELDEKIAKLEVFLGTYENEGVTLSNDEIVSLRLQLNFMAFYSDILGERVKRFEKEV